MYPSTAFLICLRDKLQVENEELGPRLGLDQRNVASALRGEYQLTLEDLLQIEEAVNVPLHDLLREARQELGDVPDELRGAYQDFMELLEIASHPPD